MNERSSFQSTTALSQLLRSNRCSSLSFRVRMDCLLSIISFTLEIAAKAISSLREYDTARWDFMVTVTCAVLMSGIFRMILYTLLDCFPQRFKAFRYRLRYDPNLLALHLSARARERAIPKVKRIKKRKVEALFIDTATRWCLQHIYIVPIFLYCGVFKIRDVAAVTRPMPGPWTVICHMMLCILLHEVMRLTGGAFHRRFQYVVVAAKRWLGYFVAKLEGSGKVISPCLVNITPLIICPILVEGHTYEVCLWYFLHTVMLSHPCYAIPLPSSWSKNRLKRHSRALSCLAHPQLHEVLFMFLNADEVMWYRCIHSSCHEVVAHYAKDTLQDVVGQDLARTHHHSTAPRIEHYTQGQPRKIDICFLRMCF